MRRGCDKKKPAVFFEMQVINIENLAFANSLERHTATLFKAQRNLGPASFDVIPLNAHKSAIVSIWISRVSGKSHGQPLAQHDHKFLLVLRQKLFLKGIVLFRCSANPSAEYEQQSYQPPSREYGTSASTKG
jgi:hypothetical protein